MQQTDTKSIGGNTLRVIDRFLRSGLRQLVTVTAGAWWGNDTAWRMTLDIGRILRYATVTGEMQSLPIRPHLVLIDGIVGGEGIGPLKPDPVHSGIILFADDPVVADYACAMLIGFDPDKIPLIHEAFKLQTYPITEQLPDKQYLIYRGEKYLITKLTELVKNCYKPAPGWQGHIEQSTPSKSTSKRV